MYASIGQNSQFWRFTKKLLPHFSLNFFNLCCKVLTKPGLKLYEAFFFKFRLGASENVCEFLPFFLKFRKYFWQKTIINWILIILIIHYFRNRWNGAQNGRFWYITAKTVKLKHPKSKKIPEKRFYRIKHIRRTWKEFLKPC